MKVLIQYADMVWLPWKYFFKSQKIWQILIFFMSGLREHWGGIARVLRYKSIFTAAKSGSPAKFVFEGPLCCNCHAVLVWKYCGITATNGGKTAVTLSWLKIVRLEHCQQHEAFATTLLYHCHNSAALFRGLGPKMLDTLWCLAAILEYIKLKFPPIYHISHSSSTAKHLLLIQIALLLPLFQVSTILIFNLILIILA